MAQFDVRLLDGAPVVELQADNLSFLGTRLVAPLLALDEVPSPVSRLHPKFALADDQVMLATHLAASVPARDLGQVLATLAEERYTIQAALDLLTTGY